MTVKRKNKSMAKLSIDPKIYLPGHRVNPARNITKKLQELSEANRNDLIMKLSMNRLLPKTMIPTYDKTNYYKKYTITGYIDIKNYIYWALGIFKNTSKELKLFNELRKQFNIALLASDSPSANKILDDIDNISLSWWSMENRIHLLKEIDKVDTKDEIKKLERHFDKKAIKNKLNDLLFLSESGSVDYFVDYISERLSEFRNSKLQEPDAWASCISSLTLPISLDPEREMDISNLYYHRDESLLDQYILFKNILLETHAKGKSLPKNLGLIIKDLAKELEDDEILCVFGENIDESPLVESVIINYTKGNYADVNESIKLSLDNRSFHIFGLIEVYARANKYIGNTFGNTLFDQIANALADLVAMDSSSRERIDYLKKICVKFRSETWCKSLSFHLSSILEEITERHVIELTRCLTKSLGGLNTPKAKAREFALQSSPQIDPNEIPYHRAIRYNLYEQETLELDCSSFPILSDYIKQQAKIYIKNKQWLELVKFSIQEYLRNKVAFLFLPISRLCKEISNLQEHNEESYISCLVVLDIYSRELNGAYDEYKAELFEEWLDSNNTHLPSTIFEEKELTSIDTYFLTNICTPNQLDNIPTYQSNFEVIYERVTILNLLITAEKDNDGSLAREKVRIIEGLFADKLRAKIETGKLFVDIQALETHRKHVYNAMFEHVKSLQSGVTLSNVEHIADAGSSKDIVDLDKNLGGVSFVAPSNEKTDALTKLYIQAAKDFALNENYGLDKYLSAEIRHVVFVEQLRSCFEKTNLITMMEDGFYLPNIVWQKRYTFVQSAALDKIDDAFKEFSRNVDGIFKDINSKFRVGIDYAENYIFDFAPYYNRIVELSQLIEKCNGFDEFFRGLIDFMWKIAGEHAKDAQDLINDQLKSKVLEELDALEYKITITKGSIPMNELMQEIRNARSYFNNEIEVVLNWFRSVGADDLDSFERLGIVIEAVVAAFESFYKHKNIDLIFTQQRSDLILSYRESRALFVALFTALENAFRYNFGGHPIVITHESGASGEKIDISNHTNPDKFDDPKVFIQQQKSKWTDSNSNLSRQEGGSGLYKIQNLLLNSSKGFGFDISLDNSIFIASVRLDNENFTHRRQPF